VTTHAAAITFNAVSDAAIANIVGVPLIPAPVQNQDTYHSGSVLDIVREVFLLGQWWAKQDEPTKASSRATQRENISYWLGYRGCESWGMDAGRRGMKTSRLVQDETKTPK